MPDSKIGLASRRLGDMPGRGRMPGSKIGPIVGVILAGGRAERMGGGDKGLREVGGKTILARVIERLRPQVDALVLNANGDPARFAAFGLPVAARQRAGFRRAARRRSRRAGLGGGASAAGALHRDRAGRWAVRAARSGEAPLGRAHLPTMRNS